MHVVHINSALTKFPPNAEQHFVLQGRLELLKSGSTLLYRYKDSESVS